MGSSLYSESVCTLHPGWHAWPLPTRDHLGWTRKPFESLSGCICGDIPSPLYWARRGIRIRRLHDSVEAWKCLFLPIHVS